MSARIPPIDRNKPLPPGRKLLEPGSGYTPVEFSELESFLSNLSNAELIQLLVKGANACAFMIFTPSPTTMIAPRDVTGTNIDEIYGWPPGTLLQPLSKKGGKKGTKKGAKKPTKKAAKKSSKKSTKKSTKKTAKKRR